MIRTHRPRGYAWNCATDFQQTQLFRDIRVEDYTNCDDDLLCSDSEDDWPLSERAAKRRRVARLADNFLNGFDLEIPSARLDPDAFIGAIDYSFPRPKDAKRAFEAIDQEDLHGLVQDDTDQWELLEAYNEAHEGHEANASTIVEDSGILENAYEESVAEIQAQSSCQRRRSRRLIKLALDPSEDALRRAAELRNRRRRQSLPEIAESQPQSCPRLVVQETQPEYRSTASTDVDTTSFSDCGPSPTPAWTSSKWLRTGAFQPRPKGVDEDCSRDELGLSSFSIASQQARNQAASRRNAEHDVGSQPSFATDAAGRPSAQRLSSFTSAPRGTGPNDAHANLSAIVEGDTGETESGGHFETEPENAGADAKPVIIPQESQLQGESQAELFIREGILAKPRQPWTAITDAKPITEEESDEEDPAPSNHATIPSSIRESVQSSALTIAGKRPKGRSTKSAGNTPNAAAEQPIRRSNRRRTAPSESQKAAEEISELPIDQRRGIRAERFEYTESVGGKNSSPFVFRKRASKLNNDNEQVATANEPQQLQAKLPAITPRRHITFNSDGSPQAIQDPRTPLVNEHLNRILPKRTTSGRQSTSLRSSLRNEMEALGAEMTRADGDQSSQPQPASQSQEQVPAGAENDENVLSQIDQDDAAEVNDGAEAILAQIAEPHVALPGTQAMLDQAHHDLFTSPDKTNSELYLCEKSTPGSLTNVAQIRRKPLGALSQERLPMPSTQALLADWHGWSSIKKPRAAGKRTSLEALKSPTVSKNKVPAVIASDPAEMMKEVGRRRSSLRYSMSFTETPFKANSPKQSSLPTHSTAMVPDTTRRHEQLSFSAPKPSGKIASSATFSFAGELSSIQLPVASTAPAETFTTSFRPQSTMFDDIDSLSFGPHQQQTLEISEHDLSFAAPLAKHQRTPKALAPTQDETVLEHEATTVDDFDAPTPSYIRNNAPTPIYIGRQTSAPAPIPAANLEYDSQDLASAVNELTRDVLGSVSELTF